ncbi:MAG TPA: hypothetical protein VIM02_01410 [Rhizomicrobium sp.]|jgi:hypothetical protein
MGDFVKAVRSGDVPQPVQRQFSLVGWAEAFRNFVSPDDADRKLFEAGIFFDRVFSELREATNQNAFRNIARSERLKAICALLNHDVAMLDQKTKEEMEKVKSQTKSGGHVIDPFLFLVVQLRSGIKCTPDQVLTILLDAGVYPLDEALLSDEGGNQFQPNNLDDVAHAFATANAYRLASDLWHSCLWLRYELVWHETDAVEIRPSDEREAREAAASDFRHEAHIREFANWAVIAWRNELTLQEKKILTAQRLVTKFDSRGSHNPFKVSKVDLQRNRNIPDDALSRMAVDDGYLKPFVDIAFPTTPTLTIGLLLKVWTLLASVGRSVLDTVKQGAPDFDWFCAHIVRAERRHIVGVLKKALDLESVVSNAAIDFLTYRPRTDGLWQKPLIRFSEDTFLIVVGPLFHGNMHRAAERWLRQGGYDLDQRGPIFESVARDVLAQAVVKSRLLKDAEVVPNPVRGPEGEEIDLLIRVGSLILVGEAKCQLFPVDPLEEFRYRARLVEAAEQANRKAETLQANSKFVRETFGLSQHVEFRVVPFALSNLLVGSGFPINGVAVTDLLFMQRLLGEGQLRKFAQMSRDGIADAGYVVDYYKNQEDAEIRIPQLLLDQPVVNDVLTQMRTRIRPTPISPTVRIGVTYFSASNDPDPLDLAPVPS